MHDHEIFHLSEFDRRSLLQIAGLATGVGLLTSLAETRASAALPAAKLPGFSAFAKSVKVFKSDKYYLVESDGIPAHQMMVYALGGYTWLNHSGLANNIQTAYPSLGADGVTTTYGDGSYGGPTLGLGAEMPVTKGIYLGVEGRHTWLGKETVATSKFNYGDVYYHQSTTTVTDEPSDWYVGVNLKLKLNHDSVGSLK